MQTRRFLFFCTVRTHHDLSCFETDIAASESERESSLDSSTDEDAEEEGEELNVVYRVLR